MVRLLFVHGVGLCLVACGGSPDLCSNLALGTGCDQTTASKCNSALATAKADTKCAPMITALANCIASLKLSCTSSTSVAAVGDGKIGGGQNFTDVGGYSVVVNDSKCDVYRRGLEACRTCPEAVGATVVEALGVGDQCTGSATACAPGLSCQGGVCTKSCTADDDCKARADGCRLQYQYGNVCAAGKCTRSCNDTYSCPAWIGTGSMCTNKACTLP